MTLPLATAQTLPEASSGHVRGRPLDASVRHCARDVVKLAVSILPELTCSSGAPPPLVHVDPLTMQQTTGISCTTSACLVDTS